MPREVEFEGRRIQVPDDATDDEIAQILGGEAPAPEAPISEAPEPLGPHLTEADYAQRQLAAAAPFSAHGAASTYERRVPSSEENEAAGRALEGRIRTEREAQAAQREYRMATGQKANRARNMGMVLGYGPRTIEQMIRQDGGEAIIALAEKQARESAEDDPVGTRLRRIARGLDLGVGEAIRAIDPEAGDPGAERGRMAAEQAQRKDDPLLARIATDTVPNVLATLPAFGSGGMAQTMARAGIVGAGSDPEHPVEGAARMAALVGLGGAAGRALERAPGMRSLPVAARAPLANAASNVPVGAAVEAAFGNEYTGEQAAADLILGAGLGLRGIGGRMRAERFGKMRGQVDARRAERAWNEAQARAKAGDTEFVAAMERTLTDAAEMAQARGDAETAERVREMLSSMPEAFTYGRAAPGPEPGALGEMPLDAPEPAGAGTESVSPVVTDYGPARPEAPQPNLAVDYGSAATIEGRVPAPARGGLGRAARPTADEAGEVIGRALDEGVVSLREVAAPETLAAIDPAAPVEEAAKAVKAVKRGKRKDGSNSFGYDPDAASKGKVEPGAVAVVAKAEAEVGPVVSSGQESPVTGRPWALAVGPDGQPVRVDGDAPATADQNVGTPADLPANRSTPAEPARGAGWSARREGESVPDYLRRVDPARRRGSNPEAGFAALPDVMEGAKAVGRGIGRVAKGAAKIVQAPFKSELGFMADADPALYEQAKNAKVKAQEYQAAVRAEHGDFQRRFRGGPGQGYVNDLQALEANPDGLSAFTRFTNVVEQRSPRPEGAAGEATDAAQRLLGKTWNTQAGYGFTRLGEGGVEPMRPIESGMGKVVPQAPNGNLFALLKQGEFESGPGKVLVDAHAALNPSFKAKVMERGADDAVTVKILTGRDAVKHRFEEMAAEARGDKGLGMEGHLASEYRRDFILADAIKVDGKWLPIQETNPRVRLDRLVNEGAQRVGAQRVLGRLDESKVAEIAKGWKGSKDDLRDFLRALYGMHKAEMPGRFTRTVGTTVAPGTAGHAAKEIAQAVLSLDRGLMLTGSPIVNAPDFIAGNTGFTYGFINGLKGTVAAARNLASTLFSGRRLPEIDAMMERGVLSEFNPDFTSRQADPAAARGMGRAGRVLRQTFSRPVEEGQETGAAVAASRDTGGFDLQRAQAEYAESWAPAQERKAHTMAQVAGIKLAEARDILAGRATPERGAEVMAQMASRATSVPHGANITAAEQGAVDRSSLMRLLTRFHHYYANNLRLTGNALRTTGEGLAGKGLRSKAGAVQNLTRFVAYKAMNGMLVNLAVALVQAPFDGGAALEREKRLIADDPLYLLKAAGWASAGGAWAQAGLKAFDRGITPSDIYAVGVGRKIGEAALGLGEAVTGTGGGLTRVAEQIERSSPLVRTVTGGAAIQSEREREKREAAEKRRSSGGRGGSPRGRQGR